MGVITLLGSAQTRLIADLLLNRLGPIELESRSLRVDKPEAFQGDERDVMFMGLVASPEGEDGPKRIGALSKRGDKQRLNVAASRARDQVWVFHSARPEELAGSDFRKAYLEYLAKPSADQLDHGPGEVLPDVRHEAFDSLFEQRVYLALVESGFRVRPQYPVGRYRIDLVVEGGARRLAIECDGDEFHGADQRGDDALRQRELERLGWTFWRVRGSQFFRDPTGSLRPLRELLASLSIEPLVMEATVAVSEEIEAPHVAADLEQKVAAPAEAATLSATTVSPGPAATRVPAGVIPVGRRSLDRLRCEADLLSERLAHGAPHTPGADARIRRAAARTWDKRAEEIEERLTEVRWVLERAHVVDSSQLGNRSWPGAVVKCRSKTTGEEFSVVVSGVDLGGEYEHVSPTAPLGEITAAAEVGATYAFDAPNGSRETVEIISVSD